jgi:hypothetical protein
LRSGPPRSGAPRFYATRHAASRGTVDLSAGIGTHRDRDDGP